MLKQSGDIPIPRDDHSMMRLSENCIGIFGGFANGGRVNDVYTIDNPFTSPTWKEYPGKSKADCQARASHSANAFDNDIYVFGG